jgi:hypothetical protein
MQFSAGARNFSLLHIVQTGTEALPSLLSTRYQGNRSPEVKWPERETSYLSASSAEDKNGGAIRLLSHTSSWHSAETTLPVPFAGSCYNGICTSRRNFGPELCPASSVDERAETGMCRAGLISFHSRINLDILHYYSCIRGTR